LASGLAAGQIKIIYEENAQVEIIAASGRRVLVDVWEASFLSSSPTASDVLLTTHTHNDHYLPEFVEQFPGKTLSFEKGPLVLADVSIEGISTVHNDGFDEGSDFIFVIDISGFRIVHFGDIGTSKLTDAQLARIGKVDIAISQLSNGFSSMDDANRKGLNLMDQVKPALIIPTHLSSATAQQAVDQWQGTYSEGPITLSRDRLPGQTTICFMGNQASSFATILKLTPAGW
jgi:L-ascorbate metabolism protein UlaG (beta-lactamase superfamily)